MTDGGAMGREGVVVRPNDNYNAFERGGVSTVQLDGNDYTNNYYNDAMELVKPAKPKRGDARTLRAKIQKRIDAYKSVENPTVAVKAVIEELEGVLAL